jgi:hypothetical protein
LIEQGVGGGSDGGRREQGCTNHQHDQSKPGKSMSCTIRQQDVTADVSRRILSAPKMAPTDVGGYLAMHYNDSR